jgi:hypothetical protein
MRGKERFSALEKLRDQCMVFGIHGLFWGIVITSEARNLLLFVPRTAAGEKQQIPHGLKAVRDDNLEIPISHSA